MKKILLILILFVACSVNSQTKKVLFLGNSYTYVNDLPNLIKNLAEADGKILVYDQNTPGGYSFQGHSTNTTSLGKISSKDWDFVILQDQSQKPSFPPSQVATDVYPYAKVLVDSIYANNECTEALFFMTWGRQNGDQDNCSSYAPLCTYEGMQGRLRESYLEMGVDNMASVSPVGIAWQKTREVTGDTINLYSSDESHPSIYGSYLAACVFYTSIFKSSPENNSFISTLSDTTAHLLQQIAYKVVTDSNYIWNFKTANFKIIKNSDFTYSFTGTENFLSETWDYGDGDIELTHNPTHTYTHTGQYTVIHTVNGTCYKDTMVQILDIVNTDINFNINENIIKVYPNPFNNVINICADNITKITLYNSLSVKILETDSKKIDMSFLTEGLYFIEISTLNNKVCKKLVKL